MGLLKQIEMVWLLTYFAIFDWLVCQGIFITRWQKTEEREDISEVMQRKPRVEGISQL